MRKRITPFMNIRNRKIKTKSTSEKDNSEEINVNKNKNKKKSSNVVEKKIIDLRKEDKDYQEHVITQTKNSHYGSAFFWGFTFGIVGIWILVYLLGFNSQVQAFATILLYPGEYIARYAGFLPNERSLFLILITVLNGFVYAIFFTLIYSLIKLIKMIPKKRKDINSS